ncbi:MAG: U32 family peptidase [Actinomycetota bacterium]
MEQTRAFLDRLGLPGADAQPLADSRKRFPDGCQYRVEIPSTESPRALLALIEAGEKYGVRIHRVSQGSGIMLMTDAEIREMLRIGRDHGMEVSLFVGPRAQWDVGGQVKSPAGSVVACGARGTEQLAYGIEDIKRGCDLGLRGVLIADPGLLWVTHEMKLAGELPANLVIKTSVQLPTANPASARVWQNLGAGTLNIAVDLSLSQIAGIRQATELPLDVYVESPDGFGGFVRHFEVPELVRVAAPVYVKLGLRNSPDIYPWGTHLESTSVALSVERVRRARIALDMVERYYPEAVMGEVGAADLAIPEI